MTDDEKLVAGICLYVKCHTVYEIAVKSPLHIFLSAVICPTLQILIKKVGAILCTVIIVYLLNT
jgi:hypothetical protein